jgi:CAAX prenyl protease-like protein
MTDSSPAASWPAWLPYVAPMATYALVFSIQGAVATPDQPTRQALYYMVAISAVALAAWLCRSTWADLFPMPTWPQLGLSMLLGALVIGAWVRLEPYYPHFAWLGKRTALDPSAIDRGVRIPYMVFRGLGLIAVVPLMEELFWRSFLMRWIAEPDFRTVPVGRVTPLAAGITSLLFASAHPEWLPALLTGLAWAGLLAVTRRLSTCWISHMTANALLGAYVLATGRWEFL